MDELDVAYELEQLHRDAALADALRRANEKHPEFDGVHCIEEDCGDEIPEARRALGKFRCIACQSMKEKNHAHRT